MKGIDSILFTFCVYRHGLCEYGLYAIPFGSRIILHLVAKYFVSCILKRLRFYYYKRGNQSDDG